MNNPTDQEDGQPIDPVAMYLQHDRWTRDQLVEYQAQALRACREYAYAHSPFYQRFHGGLMDRPLEELPSLTKAMVMEHFDELVTDPAIRLDDVQQHLARGDASQLFLDRYQATVTSGTTGNPGIFLHNRMEGAILGSSFIRSQHWAGITPASRAAVVTTTVSAQMSSQAPIKINGQRVERLQLSASDRLEKLVERLNAWQPDTLLSYSSMAATLANEQREGRLRITPRSVLCSADTLTSQTRRSIEDAWQTRLFHVYGTTEGGVLATECSFHRGMHFFEDFSIVEVVDGNNRPVPPGVQGEKVLITVLFRRTQPLIRYELSDVVCASTIKHCPCGRPFAMLESIQGRMTEVLYLLSTTGKEQAVSLYLFENTLDTLPLSGWQIVQEEDGLHVFLTGASEELGDGYLQDKLRWALTGRGLIVPPITIHRVAALNRNASGKTPMLLSRVARQAA
jgi:phenylacetate-CoA ligase